MTSPVRQQWKPTAPGADAISRMVQNAAEQGVELEVTFRAKRVTSANAPATRNLHAVNVRSVPRPNPRQGVVPQRSRLLAPVVLVGGSVSVLAVVGALVWVFATYGAVLLGLAAAVALILLSVGGSKAASHCPGVYHR